MSILRSRVTTSSFSRTASRKVAVIAVVRQQVFAAAPWPDATDGLALTAPVLTIGTVVPAGRAEDGFRCAVRGLIPWQGGAGRCVR